MKKPDVCRACPARQFVDADGRAHSAATPGDRCLQMLCHGCGDEEPRPSPAYWQLAMGRADAGSCPLGLHASDDEPVMLVRSRPASSCLEQRVRIRFGHPTGMADQIEPCRHAAGRWGCSATGAVVDVRQIYVDRQASCPAGFFGPCETRAESPSNAV